MWWQYFRFHNSRTLLSAQSPHVRRHQGGGGHQLQKREVATWERCQLSQSQAVMWAMFDKAKPYTLHIIIFRFTQGNCWVLMQQLPLPFLLIRLYQVVSNLLVLIWRDEASSNIGDMSGSRIVILSVTSPASPTNLLDPVSLTRNKPAQVRLSKQTCV